MDGGAQMVSAFLDEMFSMINTANYNLSDGQFTLGRYDIFHFEEKATV